ncbi:MAG: hypothetical protein ACLFP1_08935 [Candidatus Goldiibacteriota bacterium]
MLKNKKNLIVVFAVFLVLSAAAGIWFWTHKPADAPRVDILLSKKAGYEIIDEKTFKFWKQGYEEIFAMDEMKPGTYTVGINTERECLLSEWESENKYKYEGVIRVDFIHSGRILLSEKAKKDRRTYTKKNNVNYYGKVELYRFSIPLLGKYNKDLKISVKVVEPDNKLKIYKDCVKIFIGKYAEDTM